MLGYLSDNAKLVHRVDNAQQSVHRLSLLSYHGLVHLQLNVVVIKVFLHLLAIDVEDVEVHDGEASLPSLEGLGQVVVRDVEDSVDEGEVVFDLLVTLNVKPTRSLNN